MSTVSASPREANPAVSGFTRLLWWLATVEEPLVKDYPIDRNRQSIIGATVLCTWGFATLAWCFFFSTVTHPAGAIPLGIGMGLIVLSIDRALLKSIQPGKPSLIWAVLLRALLALLIGLFMAQPALLFLFHKEVSVQVSIDNEQRKITKKASLDSVYGPSRSAWLAARNHMQTALDLLAQEVLQAQKDFIAETDGTGGSRKIGLKDIAAAKQQRYESLYQRQLQLESRYLPGIHAYDSLIKGVDARMEKEMQAFSPLLNEGFITRTEALQHLVSQSSAVAFRYYLLIALLMTIELMPLITKWMMPSGSYALQARLIEETEKKKIMDELSLLSDQG